MPVLLSSRGYSLAFCNHLFLFHVRLQMFGAYYYGFGDRSDSEGYMKISYLANGMDKNDFLFSNSLYSLTYVRSIPRGPIVVHSTSLPSPPAIWNTVFIKMGDFSEIENMSSLFETIRYAQIPYGNCKNIKKANKI